MTPTPKFYKEMTPGTNEQDFNTCKEHVPGRYVIPMWMTSFVPGEETGAQQFGLRGKGRFFTAGVFFERLEMQGSKRARPRTWGSEISWVIRRNHIALLKGMKLPVWIPFIVDECLGYINNEPRTSPYIIWGDPLPGRSTQS
jgi:hypothetical protein